MISAWAARTFKALEYRHYRVLWIGTSLAFLAFMMSSVVQAVVAFELTGRNGAVGFVSLGMGLATILVSPFGGVTADRLPKRRLLFIGQSIIGLNFAAVGLLIVFDLITIPLLALSTLVMGAVFSFIGPARQAWIGELLPAHDLPNGIALQQVGMTLTRVIGPFVAAGLISVSFIGTGGTYLFMAGLFVFVVLTLSMLPPSQAVARGGRSFRDDMALGVRHIRARPRLMLAVVTFIGVIMAGFSYFVVLPGFLENELGRSSKDMALLMAAGAASGFVVSVGVAGAAGSRHAWSLMAAGGVVLGLSLVLLASAPNFGVALLAMLAIGAGTGAFQVLNNAIVMREAEPAYHGRVMSLTMLAWGVNGLVAYPFGALADWIGERETLGVMAAGVLVIVAGAWFASLPLRGAAAEGALPRPLGGD
ncbi:MFS transporter [Tepidiforma thermophila]|uniref:Putative MFS family arabinose efflux permease n=1 Tax=Tepidiforma thermophila (strain KCTC 52669 / CGMCC 1.13589 / G233) TaxID=2761530 RepID=A0A2A9HHV7_TEPT2|nr:MFS transporter [Tepidiforma thermophila]PFG75378.1 putative MFS family arabinose efflux permease [Tepidiforma thermophila]